MSYKNYLIISIFILLCGIFSSCNPGSYNPLFKSKYDRVVDTLRYVHVSNSQSPASDVYRIQVEDHLSIKNTLIDQISDGSSSGGGGGGGSSSGGGGGGGAEGFRVENDGTINLPKIGNVYVKGMTRKEATDKIQVLYRDSFLKDPVIDVSVINQKVTILGEVQSQGVYSLQRENTSVVEVIGLAGGFTAKSDPKTLKILRGDKSNPEIIYVNLKNLASISSPKIILQNNDIVYVEPDKKLAGYEKSQSVYSIFQTGLVVFSTGLLIYTTFFK